LLKDKTTDEDVKDEAKTEAKQLRKELGDLTKQMKESMTKAGIAPTVESALKRQKIQIEQKQPIVDDFGNVISADTALDVPLFDKQGRPVTRRTKDGKDVLKTVKGTLPEDLTPEQEVEGYERQTAKTFKYFAEREEALQRLRDAEEAERQKAYDDLQTQIKTMFEERQRLEEETGDVGDIIAAEAGKRREQKTKEVQQEMSINRMQRIVDELGLRAADLKITPDERAKIESFINEGVVNRFVTGALGIKGLGGRTVNAAQALPNIDARIQELQDERQKALVGTDPLLLDTGAPTKKGIRLMGVEAQLNELRRLRMVAEQQAPAETGAESAIEGTLQAAVSAQVESPAVDVEQGLPRVAYETRIAEADKKAARAFKDLLSFVDDLQRKRFFGGAPGLIEDARSTEEGLREQVKQSKGLIIDNLLEEVATARVARKLRPLSYSEAYLFIEDVAGLVDTLVERSLAAAPGMQTETITTPGQMRGTQLVSGATETEIDTRTERQLPFGATPRRQDIVAQMSEKQQQKIAKTFTTLRKNVKAALVKVEQIDATLNAMQPPKPVAKRGEPAPEPVQRRVVLPESPEAQRLADQRVKAVDALRKAEQALADERININASVRGVSQKQAVQTIRNVIRSIKESTIDEGKRPIRAEKPLLRQQFRTQEAETDYAQADRVVEEIDRVLAMPNLDPQVAQVLDRAATVIANENVNPTFLNTVDEQVGRILRGIDKPFTPVADPTQPARRPPADRQAMLINEIQQDIDNKVAVSAAAMQDITTQAQGDMFAEDLATIRATPGMFRRLQKSRKVVKKRERIATEKAETAQTQRAALQAKREVDFEFSDEGIKQKQQEILDRIKTLAAQIQDNEGYSEVTVKNFKYKWVRSKDPDAIAAYKKEQARYDKTKPEDRTRLRVPFPPGSWEIVGPSTGRYTKRVATMSDRVAAQWAALDEDIKKEVANLRELERKVRAIKEKSEQRKAAARAATQQRQLVSKVKQGQAKLLQDQKQVETDLFKTLERAQAGLGLSGARFERKTPEEIAKEIAEARAERKAAIKAAGAKTKEQKAAIPLKLKSRFKVAAIKSAEEIEADRRKIQSGSFNPTLSPEDVQIKVQEEFDKALENRNKAKKELADFRKLVNEAKGAKDFAKYEKEFFTKLKELSAVVNVAQAKYVSARYNLDLINKTTIRDFKGRRETAPRTIAGPITQSQIKYTSEQLSMLTGMPANMMPRITTAVDDDTTKFAIGDSKPETSVDFAEAEKRLKEVKALAKKMGVEVKIYPSVADAPTDISRAMARQDLDPLTDSVKGGVLPNGDVFIIVDAHSSMLDLEQTVAHELVGHYSFESMLGKDGMENLMRKVDKSFATKENQNGLENLADSLGLRDQYNAAVAGAYNFYKTRLEKGELTEKDVLRLAKTDGLREIIAYTMEKRVDQSFMQKAKRWLQELAGAFRALLKRLGLVDAANMSTSDLFYLMKQAHDNFTAGKPMAFTKPDGTVSLRQPVVPVFATPLASMVAAPSSALGSLKANLFGLNFRVQFVDRLAALDALVKKGVEKAIIPALKAMDVMYFSRFAGQRNNFTADYLTSGVGRIERVKGELMYVGGDGPSMRDVANALRQSGIPDKQVETAFTAFLIARRAEVVGVDKLDYSETITDLEVKATLAQFAKNQPFQKAAGLYDQYNNNLIDLMVQAEALDPKKAERLKNSKYVPYYREKNGGIELVIGTEKPVRIGSFVDQPQLRELKGGVNKILPVFTGSVQNTQMIVDIVLRNMAAKSTAFVLNQMGLMDIRTGGGPKLSDGTPSANVVRFTILENQGGEKKLVEKYAVMKPEVGDAIFGNIPTELVMRGMEGIKTTIPGIVRLMGLPANWLRNFVTKNPRYAVNQVFRDSMAAVITTGADFVPVVQTIKDLATMNRNGSLGTLRGRGVVGGQVITGATDDADKILRQITAGKPGWEMTMAKLDEFAMMGDAATRVSMYNSFLKQGLSEREATFASLEAMNFSRRGLSPTAMYANTVIPFFNAQVQGLDVLYRAAIGDMPASQRLKVQHKMKVRMLMMGVFTLAYAAMMEEDEAYKNANPEERYSNWFVPTPFGTFRVPIPFELGFVAKSIPEGIYRLAATDDKASSVLGALRKQLFASIPGDLPIAAKVPVELMLNKSFFTGRPVIDARLEGLVKSEQFGQKTPELIKLLGFDSPQVIKDVFGLQGVSPAQVEYFIKGYTGTLPLALLRLFDPVLASGEVVKADMKLEDMPIVGSFFQPKDAGGIINASYAGIQQAQRVSNTYKKLIADGRIKEATEYFNENTAAFSIASLGGAFQQQMGELTKAERAIRASDLSSAEKRERLDEFRQIKIDYSKQFRTIKEQIERQASRSGLQ
jgi:hypothetical protein